MERESGLVFLLSGRTADARAEAAVADIGDV